MGCGGIKVMEDKEINSIEKNINEKENSDINNDMTDIKINNKGVDINNSSKCYTKPKENKIDNNENDIINKMFNKHSELRKMHGCSKDFELDNSLSSLAKKRAEKLISSKNEIFSEDLYNKEVLGENILISDKILKSEEICDKWYNEGQNYNYEKNKFQKGTGHFTQIVWKNTEKVGFGIKNDKSKMVVVAYYYPAGNIFGEFTKNVENNKKENNINNE